MGGHRQLLFPGPRLPPTPESPAEPTFLPHVRESLPTLFASQQWTPSPAKNTSSSARASEASGSPVPSDSTGVVFSALNVLLHTREALANLHQLYGTSAPAQHALACAAAAISASVQAGGRLVVSGVGKSGKIGEKLVATCNSLQIRAAWMHASEAVHGDLGMLGPNDTVLLISYSATTPELINLIPHIPSDLPLVVMTGGFDALPVPSRPGDSASSSGDGCESEPLLDTITNKKPCPLFVDRPSDACTNIILPAPIPVTEAAAFGVAAPTTSTTVAVALGDALALAVAGDLHDKPNEVFRRNHPGGSIGMVR